jgi:hypothetical protein
MAQRGPRTSRGKQSSSQNAVKHGLRSGDPVIPIFESFEEWESFRDGIVAGYEPQGRLETELAHRSALLLWRLKRVVRYETEMTAHYLDDIPDDMVTAARYAQAALGMPIEETVTPDKVDALTSRRLLAPKDSLERVMRYEGHLHRQWVQTHHELEAIQARRRGERASPLARLDVSGSPVL